MEPLDKSNENINPAFVSPQPIAIRYGLIWGLIGILLGLLAHIMGWNDPVNPNMIMSMMMGLLSFGISVTMIVLAIKQHRDQDLGGYLTFGRGFKTGFMTTVVYAIIATIWIVIFFTLINPDFFNMMEAGMIDQWEEQGLSDEQIDQAKGIAGMFTGPVAMPIMTFLGSLFWGALISLVATAVLKKEPPIHQF